jgi:diguanylate cyclase (GGDEF)-like protein
MTVTALRGGRDSAIFVLLTPILMLLSVCLEKADPRVPGKFSFLVLLVPTLLVALTGKRWQGLTTALISGAGCIVAGWLGAAVRSSDVSMAGMTMPVLLGGALLSIGSLLTLRCDDAQQRITSLGTAVDRIVAAENLDELSRNILDAVSALVPIRVCELHVWEPREQQFVRMRVASRNSESGELSVWDPRTSRCPSVELHRLAQADQSPSLFGDWRNDGPALAPTVGDWSVVNRALGTLERDEHRVPLTSGDGEVFGFLRFQTERRLPPEFDPLVHILAKSAALALKNVRLFQRLRDQAQRDGLTGLANHAVFHGELKRSLEATAAQSGTLALALLDLDQFKQVNDRHGHQIGDRVLQTLGEQWQQIVPPGAVLARCGGDEFACLLPEHDAAKAREHLSALMHRLATSPIDTDDERLLVEPSIGLALYPADARTAEELFRRADEALYIAKRGGGGIVYIGDDQPEDDRDCVCGTVRSTRNHKPGHQPRTPLNSPVSIPFSNPHA